MKTFKGGLRKILATPLLHNKKFRVVLICIVSVVVVAGLGLFIANKKSTKKPEAMSCSTLLSETTKSAKPPERNFKAATTSLVSNEISCVNNTTKSETLRYYSQVALFSYASGDKETARQFAKRAQTLSAELSIEDKSKIVSYSSVIAAMGDISSGNYDGSYYISN